MIFVLRVLIYFICCITCAAYMSLLERKLIAKIQLRVGPNNCGILGTLQPIADALKLLFKRSPLIGHSKQSIFGVCLLFTAALTQLTLIPISNDVFNPRHELLLIILCHGIMAFSEILIGTSSKSKYGIIGGNRAFLQLLGGHIPFVLSIIVIMPLSNSMNLSDFINLEKDFSFIIKCIPLAVTFFIVLLITGNRTPFDLTEAESELVGGAYVEYGGILFAMIYLSDYLNLLFISALTATLFLGGYGSGYLFSPLFGLILKTFLIMCFIILIRAILPRYTQDQMIKISWTILIPILFIYIIF